MVIRLCAPALAVVALTSIPAAAPGRVVEVWDYDKLFKTSDVVVIASFESSTPIDKTTVQIGRRLRVPAVSTKLTVVYSLKGDCKQREVIELLHWKFDPTADPTDGAPEPVVFSKQKVFDIGATSFGREVNYLLFLRKKEKQYEFTTGIAECAESVKELLSPSFDRTQ